VYAEVKKSKNDEVVISVKDRGTGIDPDIQDKLFSKFATKSEIGMGLGLFISKGIVKAHGGKIWAQNNKDRNGATFAFSLPLSE
jgi:signal transduction histidine kinase